tara:strand:+ start:21181 stop:21459 length:279 start_codon:yes stop_codon:yes gene_type:complete
METEISLFACSLVALVIGVLGYFMIFKKTDPETGKLKSRFLTEAPSYKPLEKMSKKELLEFARHHGIDMVKNLKKGDMVTTLKNCGLKEVLD